MLWTLTWWASDSCWAPAASVSLGADGPRKPPGTHSVWGRNLISSGLAPAPPWPPASTYHLEGELGPSRFLWLPVALELGGEAGVYVILSACPPFYQRRWGRICGASPDSSAQGPLEIWEDPGPQGGRSGSQQQSGDWYLIPPNHSHREG